MNLLQALAVTAELTGTELSKHAIQAMEADLQAYPLQAVLDALTRCRRELTGRLSLAAIIERVNANDGRLQADEAWSLAINAQSEAATVVWTEEISQAFFDAQHLLDAGDKTGARMAFKDSYQRRIEQARANGESVRWVVSPGYDPAQRETALLDAAIKGRLSHEHVAGLLPYREGSDAKQRLENILLEAKARMLGNAA